MPFDLTDPEQLALRAPGYALAFAESMRALDAQDRVAGELATRAGVLTAGAAVSTSIFGGQALARGQHTTATWIALVAFLGVCLSVAGLLWPRHEWQFDALPSRLLAEYVEPEAVPLPVIHCDLVLHRAVSIERNTRQIRRLLVGVARRHLSPGGRGRGFGCFCHRPRLTSMHIVMPERALDTKSDNKSLERPEAPQQPAPPKPAYENPAPLQPIRPSPMRDRPYV